MPDFIIRNFQSIKEAKLSCKGFTLLIGQSSQGKSACLRSIYAATHNRFKIGQVRNGEEFATVKVRYEENGPVLTVQRSKTGSPIMRLGDLTFSKLSRSVPPQIEEFNNFGSIEVAGETYSLSFHDQFDKPLLLEYSQKKVMEILSASRAIDDHNKVHYALSKKREQNRGAFKTVDALLNENHAKLSMLKYDIEQMSDLYSRMEATDSLLSSTKDKFEYLSALLNLVREHEVVSRKIELISVLLSKYTILSKVESLMRDIKTLKTIESREEKMNHYCSIYSTDLRDLVNDYETAHL